MKFVDRPKLRQRKYDDIIEAVGKLTSDNALEIEGVEYDSVISIRTMVWSAFGRGRCRTKYNKHAKELIIWKL